MEWITSSLFWQLIAFVMLIFGGVIHFYFDVLQPYLMATQKKELRTVSYLGLHSFFASGMVLTGLVNLYLTLFQPAMFSDAVYVALLMVWSVVWTSGAFLFMDMKMPKITMSVYMAILVLSVLF